MKLKNFFSITLCIAMFGTFFSSVLAEEVHPTVSVDDRLILFKDQQPVISKNDDTLIPVRGVLEAMGATVEWDGEKRTVYVKSKDQITRLLFTLDNPVLIKYTLTSIKTVDKEVITLSTAPTLMNERTMIPLRVIGENFDGKVGWNQDTKHITISTKEYLRFISEKKAELNISDDNELDLKEILPYIYIETDKTEVQADEEINVYVKLRNSDKIDGDFNFSGFVSTIIYDNEELELVSVKEYLGGDPVDTPWKGSNDSFMENSAKHLFVVMPDSDSNYSLIDGLLTQFTFKSINGGKTAVSLSDRYTSIGYDTELTLIKDTKSTTLKTAKQIALDTTPIIINNNH